MTKRRRFFLPLLKRSCHRVLPWVLAALLFLVMVLYGKLSLPKSGGTRVLIVNGDAGSMGEEILNVLLSSDSAYTFEEAASEEQLYEEVLAGEAECGFVLPSDFTERMEAQDTDGLVTYVSSSYTTRGEAAKETFYAAYFADYAKVLLKNRETALFGGESGELSQALEEETESVRSSGNLFDVVFESVDGKTLAAKATPGLPDTRAVLLCLVFSGLLFAGSARYEKDAASLSLALPSGERERFCLTLQLTESLPLLAAGAILYGTCRGNPLVFVPAAAAAYLVSAIAGHFLKSQASYTALCLSLTLGSFALLVCSVVLS